MPEEQRAGVPQPLVPLAKALGTCPAGGPEAACGHCPAGPSSVTRGLSSVASVCRGAAERFREAALSLAFTFQPGRESLCSPPLLAPPPRFSCLGLDAAAYSRPLQAALSRACCLQGS